MRVHTEVDPATKIAYTVEIEPEHIPVRGNALASGDDAEDRKAEQAIERQLRNGNLWAWCAVTVTALRGEYEGSDHLGACSYRNTADFVTEDGYYPDMKREAYAALLIAELEATNGR
jgi:hypothetical protein